MAKGKPGLGRKDRASVRYLLDHGVEAATLINIFHTTADQVRSARFNFFPGKNEGPRDRVGNKKEECPHDRYMKADDESKAEFVKRISAMDDEPIYLWTRRTGAAAASGSSSVRSRASTAGPSRSRISANERSTVGTLRSVLLHSKSLVRVAESSDEDEDASPSDPSTRPRRSGRNKRNIKYVNDEDDASEHKYNTRFKRAKRQRESSEDYVERSASQSPRLRSPSPPAPSRLRRGQAKGKSAIKTSSPSPSPELLPSPTPTPAPRPIKAKPARPAPSKVAAKLSPSVSDRARTTPSSITSSSKTVSTSRALSSVAGPRTPANGKPIPFAQSHDLSHLPSKPLLGRANPPAPSKTTTSLPSLNTPPITPISSMSSLSESATNNASSAAKPSASQHDRILPAQASAFSATTVSSAIPSPHSFADPDLPPDLVTWLNNCPLSAASFDRPAVARIFKELGLVTLEIMKWLADGDDDARKESLAEFRKLGGTMIQGRIWMDMLKRWKNGGFKEFAPA